MKYVIEWKRKRHGTTAAYEEGQRQVLALMRAWKRPEGVTIHQWVVRAGTTGGYAVVETDEPAAMHAATRAFAGMNFTIDPVLDIDVAPAAAGQAIARRDAAI